MRREHEARVFAAALIMAFLSSNRALALPPPIVDRTGDSVRIVEWGDPVPIPGLSRASKLWLESERVRPMPPAVARRVYAERRARLLDLARSAEVFELLGLDPAVDVLEPLPGDASWRAVALAQYHRGALVRAARVTLNLAPDNASVASIVSTAQPDLSPPAVEVAPDEAVATALSAAEGLISIPLVAGEYPPPLMVIRQPAPLAGARRAAELRRGNDQLVYAVHLVTDDAVSRQMVAVWVDAATAQPMRTFELSSHPLGWVGLGKVKPVNKAITAGQAAFENWVQPLLYCANFEGQGADVDTPGILRRFSTTYYPKESLPFALVSCNEWAEPARLIKSQDVVTFRDNPQSKPPVEAKVYRDDDDKWVNDKDPLLRHAVNSQYWGERALRYYKKNGYTHRLGSGTPVRFVAWQKGTPETARFWDLETTLGAENGEIDIGIGGPHFKTSADPMVLAHELGHSLWFDVLPGPPDGTEERAIFEGLADCFAMAAMNDMQQEWEADPTGNPPHPGYDTLGTFAPFSFWAGSYDKDDITISPGYPNLYNPKKSWPLDWPSAGFRFTTWSGNRSTFSDYEKDSTLLGAVCRLMVTGGPTVAVPKSGSNSPAAVTAAGYSTDALATGPYGVVDRQLGFARLTRLLKYTFLDAQAHPTSFHDLINILAVNRKTLASTEWSETSSEERTRRTFAEYGFGRGDETEPNNASTVGSLGPTAAANLIALGSKVSREITGSACAGDEDFFVVNETIAPGDEIHYTISALSNPTPPPEFDIRFYRHEPCSFEEGLPKTCALEHQIHPPTGSDGSTPQIAPPNSVFAFKGLSGGGCPPLGCAGSYWKMFVGVRLKSGPCKVKYNLSLTFQKRPKGVE